MEIVGTETSLPHKIGTESLLTEEELAWIKSLSEGLPDIPREVLEARYEEKVRAHGSRKERINLILKKRGYKCHGRK